MLLWTSCELVEMKRLSYDLVIRVSIDVYLHWFWNVVVNLTICTRWSTFNDMDLSAYVHPSRIANSLVTYSRFLSMI